MFCPDPKASAIGTPPISPLRAVVSAVCAKKGHSDIKEGVIGTASAGRALFLALDTLTWIRRLAGGRFRVPGRGGARIRRAVGAGQANLAPHARRDPARDPDQSVASAVWRGTVK